MAQKHPELTPDQLRVLAILAPLKDEDTFRWPNMVWEGHPTGDMPLNTMNVLIGCGLVELKKKNMGGGITNRYYCLTEAGRQYVSTDPDTPSVTTT